MYSRNQNFVLYQPIVHRDRLNKSKCFMDLLFSQMATFKSPFLFYFFCLIRPFNSINSAISLTTESSKKKKKIILLGNVTRLDPSHTTFFAASVLAMGWSGVRILLD